MKDVNSSERSSASTEASFLNNNGGKLSGLQMLQFFSLLIAVKMRVGEKSILLRDRESEKTRLTVGMIPLSMV